MFNRVDVSVSEANIMWMDSGFYFSIIGIAAALGLLGYFTARYREAFFAEEPPLPASAPRLSHLGQPTPEASLSDINRDISVFKNRVQEMKKLAGEKKTLQEQQINDIIGNINTIVEKLESIEPGYLNEVSPKLQSLISDLETLRSPLPAEQNGPSADS